MEGKEVGSEADKETKLPPQYHTVEASNNRPRICQGTKCFMLLCQLCFIANAIAQGYRHAPIICLSNYRHVHVVLRMSLPIRSMELPYVKIWHFRIAKKLSKTRRTWNLGRLVRTSPELAPACCTSYSCRLLRGLPCRNTVLYCAVLGRGGRVAYML
eukprot:IDg17140t1